MTNEGLGALLRFVQHAYDLTPADHQRFDIWRSLLAQFGDDEILELVTGYTEMNPAKPPTAVLLAARARVLRREQAAARVAAVGPQTSTMLTGHSRCPRRPGEELGDYLFRLGATLEQDEL